MQVSLSVVPWALAYCYLHPLTRLDTISGCAWSVAEHRCRMLGLLLSPTPSRSSRLPLSTFERTDIHSLEVDIKIKPPKEEKNRLHMMVSTWDKLLLLSCLFISISVSFVTFLCACYPHSHQIYTGFDSASFEPPFSIGSVAICLNALQVHIPNLHPMYFLFHPHSSARHPHLPLRTWITLLYSYSSIIPLFGITFTSADPYPCVVL